MKTLKYISRRIDCCLLFLWELNLALFFLSASFEFHRGRWQESERTHVKSNLQLLELAASAAPWILCFQPGMNLQVSDRAEQDAWPLWCVSVAPENKTACLSCLASCHLVQTPCTAWYSSIPPLFSMLNFSWQTPTLAGFWTLYMLWLLGTWKPWRNTAEPASSKAPLHLHENGAASIKVLLKPVSPLEKHSFKQKSPLFLLLYSSISSFLFPFPSLSLSFPLFPTWSSGSSVFFGLPAPCKQTDLAGFGKCKKLLWGNRGSHRDEG